MFNEELKIKNELIAPSYLVIPLQWFADGDEDAPEKTEQPTDYRLRKLREEGQTVKSQEIISAFGLLLPALLLLFLAPSMLRTCVEMVRFFLMRAVEMDPTKDMIIALVFLRYFAMLVWPILTVAIIAALLSNILQDVMHVGFFFTARPLVPDFSKTLPKLGQYFKRIFSGEGFFNFVKSIIKIIIIGAVSFILISSDFERLTNLQKTDVYTGLLLVASIAIKMLLIAALLMGVISAFDYYFQRRRFLDRHKMTRYEMKKERKELEGDPMIESLIRARFRELLRQNIYTAVPKADVVITNPTHLAIALQYEQRSMPPMVVAMGVDEMAASIRKIAQENDVPLVENKPLAWAMYHDPKIKIGYFIPETYWQTVALILSKVWHMNEERRGKLSA